VNNLRKSWVGAWRMIHQVTEEPKIVLVVMIERRGQVYKRV
jgi:mRNA-degrading endonuclease RelE of RelBE toxin-antitoxin system